MLSRQAESLCPGGIRGSSFCRSSPNRVEELYRRGHRNLHLLLFGNQEKSVDYPFPSTNAGFITDMNKLPGFTARRTFS